MAAQPPREQALPLLATAHNHGDLAVKLSSLKQVKDILSSAEPSQAAQLFPYLVELHSSPETLVRKTLIDIIVEVGLRSLQHLSILMPALLSLLKDQNSSVAKLSSAACTVVFCRALEEITLQFRRRGIVEAWQEELWAWMVKSKDAVIGILFEAAPLGLKLLSIKFLETHVILFTPDKGDSERFSEALSSDGGQAFNMSWLGSHPFLDPVSLSSDANGSLGVLLDLLQAAGDLPGLLAISVVNSLAAIGRRRPLHYTSILSALLDFDANFVMTKGGHSASIRYSIRTAFLGFLRSISPVILESRERLLKCLRAMNAGDAADQVVRQVEKLIRNTEIASRDARLYKEEQPVSLLPSLGDQGKKRSAPSDNEDPTFDNDTPHKRVRHVTSNNAASHFGKGHPGEEYVNGTSPKIPILDTSLTPAEQMIAMIAALIAEGERGVTSLEILISNIHPDLLADIVITNMRHLPKSPPPLANTIVSSRNGDSSGPSQSVAPSSSTVPADVVEEMPISSSNTIGPTSVDMSASVNLSSDSKRDPRRDPRRLDPRRVTGSVGVPVEGNANAVKSDAIQLDAPGSSNTSFPLPVVSSREDTLISVLPKSLISGVPKSEGEMRLVEDSVASDFDSSVNKDLKKEEPSEVVVVKEEGISSLIASPLPGCESEQEAATQRSPELTTMDGADSPPVEESEEFSPAIMNISTPEDIAVELPVLPSYVDLNQEQLRNIRRLAIKRIFDSYKFLQGPEAIQIRLALVARMVAQIHDDDDGILSMQKDLVLDYHHQKGHELVMHVLYHLHSRIASDSGRSSDCATATYEKFLEGVAKSLLDSLPATDKSFSRLLGEVPFLTDSVIRLLDDLCCEKYCGNNGSDGDRVTQGLGAVWSLILGRPVNRQACLDIALKCAVHSQDDIRAKAIRLVANKLYAIDYISDTIEQFATRMFSSVLDQPFSEAELLLSRDVEQPTEPKVGSQKTFVDGSQAPEPGVSGSDSTKGSEVEDQSDSVMTLACAQRLISLYFALCPKKPSLLRLIFSIYARAPKAVKQAVHRQIPILIRALGWSHSELLQIISDPPPGSDNLLTQVLQILSEGTTPSADLVATVKHLYETKLKDATILIPILSSFSKNEVLPIFPRLLELPSDKFQSALAHILQGSAHTGPALTPVEVMVAIHDINPERDHLPLKKIMDVCSVCFEQRTVFTQHVMAKALSQMVDKTPLPLLYMRTVIQTMDAFPSLLDKSGSNLLLPAVDSKKECTLQSGLCHGNTIKTREQTGVENAEVVGWIFEMCFTQPHSFRVLLLLPSTQLDGALHKYPHLRGPLAAYASQSNVTSSLSRSTLSLLGLVNESKLQQQSHMSSSLRGSDTSSLHGAMPI